MTFDRQAGPLQNFNRSHTPGGGVGRPKHPKIPPPPENPRNIFEKKKISREKKLRNFGPPPPPPQILFFIFFCVLRPQEHFLANFCFSVKNSTLPPPPTCTPPPSPQNTHPNPRAIINNPNNCSIMV